MHSNYPISVKAEWGQKVGSYGSPVKSQRQARTWSFYADGMNCQETISMDGMAELLHHDAIPHAIYHIPFFLGRRVRVWEAVTVKYRFRIGFSGLTLSSRGTVNVVPDTFSVFFDDSSRSRGASRRILLEGEV